MPGLSLIFNKGGLISKRRIIEEALNSNNHLNNFDSNIYLHNDNLFIGWNKYSEYPIKAIEKDGITIIIEGEIYSKNKTAVINQLTLIIKSLEKYNDAENELRSWLLNTDGDFIICIINNNTNKNYVINDIFGRLPVYYKIVNDGVIISRYLKFITNIEGKFSFDRMGLAQFLLFGYMLGQRTLIENVNHLRPASFLSIEKSGIKFKTLHDFNFDYRKHINISLNDNIDELSRRFSEASINRVNNFKKNIVTLSGGLDSRLVATCMYKNNIPFEAATMSYKSGYAKEEIEVAQKLSNLFNVSFNLLEITPPTGKDVYELLKVKEGMNSLATSPMLPFYRKVTEFFGNKINLLTGDNGDKLIFTIDRPIKKNNSIEELANYIVFEHSIVDLKMVYAITNVERDIFFNELINILKSFPEISLSQKYLHFRIIEKPFKYAFQGEDRHRNYLWHLTPFWSIPFFEYIMNCSDESKIKHQLFGGLIEKYSPDAIRVPYTNFRSSIISLKGKAFMNMIYYAYPKIPYKIKKSLKNGFFGGDNKIQSSSILYNCVNSGIKNSTIIANYLNLNEEILKPFRTATLYNILTLNTIIEDFNGKNSIEKYLNDEFD